jgi:hypothetical protein
MSSVKIDLDEMRRLSGLGPQYPEWTHAPKAAPLPTEERRAVDKPEPEKAPTKPLPIKKGT